MNLTSLGNHEAVTDRRQSAWFDWLQILIVGLAAPSFLFPSKKSVWAFLIILGMLFCRGAIKKSFFKRTALDWPLGILLIQIFLSCLLVPDINFSIPKIAGAIYGIIVFYSLVSIFISNKIIEWGIRSFLGIGLLFSVISILGMAGYFWTNEKLFNQIMIKISEHFPKINWHLAGAEDGFNPNPIGGILILIIPLCLVFLFSSFQPDRCYKMMFYQIIMFILLLTIVLVMGGVLFLTQSLGSWFALTISIWVVLLPKKWKKYSLVLFLLLIVIMISINKDKTLRYLKSAQEIVKSKIELHEPLWQVGYENVRHNPLFGIGMNRIRLKLAEGYAFSHAHNHLLHTAAELGLPALIAYLAVLFGAGHMCYEIWRKATIKWMKGAALGLGSGQLAHFIFGMGDSIPLGAKAGIFFWLSLGLITALYNAVKRNHIE